MQFLRNTWYVVAWAENVAPGPTRIKVLGEPVALYRLQSGKAAALSDRCPHRSASLGDGKIIDDALKSLDERNVSLRSINVEIDPVSIM